MATEYKTIRVHPNVHALAAQITEKIRMRGMASLPAEARGGMHEEATICGTVEAALKLLDVSMENEKT